MSDPSQRLSHARWHGKYHVVFVPQRRRKALCGNRRKALGPILPAGARQKECRLIAGHGMPEHGHRGIEMPPKHAVASVIGFLNGPSAIATACQWRGRERHCTGAPCWARGYAVSPVGFALEHVRYCERMNVPEGWLQQILTCCSQPEQARQPLHLLIKEVITLLRAALPSTMTLRYRPQHTTGTVLADPTQPHQVLLNLCTNAAHAMRATGGVLAGPEPRLEAGAQRTLEGVGSTPLFGPPALGYHCSAFGHSRAPPAWLSGAIAASLGCNDPLGWEGERCIRHTLSSKTGSMRPCRRWRPSNSGASLHLSGSCSHSI